MKRLRILTLAGGLTMVCLSCWVRADRAEAHLGRTYLLVQDQRYEDAAAEFQAALTIDRSLLRARYQLTICRFANGDQEEARREFESLPKESQADAGVVYHLGRLDLLAYHYQSAAARFGSIAAKPPFPDTAFDLGLAWYGQGNLPADGSLARGGGPTGAARFFERITGWPASTTIWAAKPKRRRRRARCAASSMTPMIPTS